MNEYQKTLLDLQLDQACEQLKQLIRLGKVLPDYNKIWHEFALQTMQKKGGKKCIDKIK